MKNTTKSNRVVLAQVSSERENLSPLLDFNMNFTDRQNLQVLENYVTDLQVILPTLLNDVIAIVGRCQSCCQRHCNNLEGKCDCDLLVEEFNGHVKQVEMYIRRVEVLRKEVKSTAHLVSILLL
jgi:hypothetical protein